jgi:hypothetical protein
MKEENKKDLKKGLLATGVAATAGAKALVSY